MHANSFILSSLSLIFIEILVGVPPAAGPVFSYKLRKGGVGLKKLRRLIIFYKFPCKTKPTQISINCVNINRTVSTSVDGDSWAVWTKLVLNISVVTNNYGIINSKLNNYL